MSSKFGLSPMLGASCGHH